MRGILVVLLACAIAAGPAACMSRWFTSAYTDLKYTLYRYGHCISGLQPMTSVRFNETEYLVNQMRLFLDQGNYDNEQLANVSSLMDTICRTSAEPSYPISVHVNITSFNSSTNPLAKETRCRAIEDAMESMYYVFKRSALNRSESLDFSTIQFYSNETDKNTAYNLSDLINTSWITSEVVLEHVCSITNATKEYVRAKSSQARPDRREDRNPLAELIDRLLDSVLGLQKRLYWESTNRWETIQMRVNSGLSSVRNGVGHGLGKTADLLLWRRPERHNSTLVGLNVTDGFRANLTAALSNFRPFRNNSTAKPSTSMDNVPTTTSFSTTTTTPLPTRLAAANRTATGPTTIVV